LCEVHGKKIEDLREDLKGNGRRKFTKFARLKGSKEDGGLRGGRLCIFLQCMLGGHVEEEVVWKEEFERVLFEGPEGSFQPGKSSGEWVKQRGLSSGLW